MSALFGGGFLLLFLGFFALVIVLIVVEVIQNKKRREALTAFAGARGWTMRDSDPSLVGRFGGHPFDTGGSRRATNCLYGSHDGRHVVAFDYQYETTSGTGEDRRTTTHSYSVVAMSLGTVMPRLAVSPEGAVGRFFGRLTNKDIELESEDFNRAFTVTADDRRFASDVLHPQMMQMLLQWPAEAYPDLKANQSFLHLQHELTNTEDRIAASRRFYNGNVRAYNTRVRTFPSNVVAAMFGFDAREFFELRDQAAALPPAV